MNPWRLSLAIICATTTVMLAQVQQIEDAPEVLRLPSGAEVKVLEIFKTTFVETDEPCLVLRYPTTKTKEDLCTEAEEVFTAFQPVVEKQDLRAAVIFQATDSGGGFTRIWKQDINGAWKTSEQGDKGVTPNGMNGYDLVEITRRASAIVRLRLILDPNIITDPEYPNSRQQMIDKVLVVQTLKKNADFLGEVALRQACSAWQPGDKWLFAGSKNYADYFVFEMLPLGDFDKGLRHCGGRYLISETEGVLHMVERGLNSQPAAQ